MNYKLSKKRIQIQSHISASIKSHKRCYILDNVSSRIFHVDFLNNYADG